MKTVAPANPPTPENTPTASPKSEVYVALEGFLMALNADPKRVTTELDKLCGPKGVKRNSVKDTDAIAMGRKLFPQAPELQQLMVGSKVIEYAIATSEIVRPDLAALIERLRPALSTKEMSSGTRLPTASQK